MCGGHLPVCQRLDSHIVQWSARVHHRRDCLSVCPAGTYSAAGAASCTSICHGCVLSLVSCRVVAACACSVLLCGSVSGGSQLWRRHICRKHHRCARHMNLATTVALCLQRVLPATSVRSARRQPTSQVDEITSELYSHSVCGGHLQRAGQSIELQRVPRCVGRRSCI